jgi:sigma-B regulation protein RsbU (phosphoserine phosphatase)
LGVATNERETSFRELYESAPCGLLSTSESGLILAANVTFCSWLGYAREELVLKRRVQDLLTMGGKIFHQTHWMPLLRLQGSVAEVQLELVRHDGATLAVLLNAMRREDLGPVRHELAVFVATDRRKYERELLEARKRAEDLLARERAAQEALATTQAQLQGALEQRALLAEQLVGIVSHDLRTPMAAIQLGAGQLASQELSSLQARLIQRIMSAASRANRLIADLLDFTQARIGSGLRVSAQPIELHVVVRDCLEELKLASPNRMIEHVCSGEDGAFADPDRLAQIVVNLVGNALTYGDSQRAITVTSAVARSNNEQQASLTVHNFGTPIAETLLPHIFEPMRRGDLQVKHGSRSVGLGLYIVREIAVAHGGQVDVRSSVEEGTTFTVTIPSRPPDQR